LMFPMKVNGLALATSLASIFNFFSLYFLLRKKIGPLGGREIFVSFVRAAIPGAIMAVVLILLNVNLQLRPVPKLAVIIPAGAASFFIACLIFDVKEFKGFVKWILRRG